MAQKCTELKPVQYLTYSDAQSSWAKCATPIPKQGGGIPRRSALVLMIHEEVTRDGKYGLVLVFEAKALQFSDFEKRQCRQKTEKFTVSCKNLKKGGKPCPLRVCETCLLGRYGEIAKEMALLDDWKCPKCRSLCNCSNCMKSQGQQPTGPLSSTAKANGFNSVSDMLIANAAAAKDLESNKVNDAAVSPSKEATVKKKEKKKHVDNSRSDKVLKSEAVLAMKQITSEKELEVFPGELGKENSSDAESSLKQFKTNCAELKEISNENDVDINRDTACVLMDGREAWAANDCFLDVDTSFPYVGMSLKMGKIEDKFPLPPGSELTEIVDIEFHPEYVGSVLQFLEFCRTFGKVLDLKKGEPEAILRELIRKQNMHGGQNNLTVQFHIRVLALILTDLGNESVSLTAVKGKNSWLKPLEFLINESEDVLKDFPMNWLREGVSGYHNLEPSEKLRLLNFLCDEALGTKTLRNFIGGQNSIHAEEVKEAKAKVAIMKEKEKGLRNNLQNEMAKVVPSEASLPMEEHDALLTEMKSDLAEAHAEVLKLKGMVPKGKRSDATRIEPLFSDSNGQVFWKLKSFNGDDSVLLQDIKIQDETATAPGEKWFVYGAEKKGEVEKYISSRVKMLKNSKISDMLLK